MRIRHSLLLEEELNNREAELNDLLEFKQEMKVRHRRLQTMNDNGEYMTRYHLSYGF